MVNNYGSMRSGREIEQEYQAGKDETYDDDELSPNSDSDEEEES